MQCSPFNLLRQLEFGAKSRRRIAYYLHDDVWERVCYVGLVVVLAC